MRRSWAFLLLAAPALLSAASFEPLGEGAAAKAMGQAYAAKADDLSAGYWNPAGLAFLKSPQVQGSVEDVNGLGLLRYSTLGYAQPNIGGGAAAFTLLHLGTKGEAKFIEYAESTYMFSYGRPFGRRWAAGAGVRHYAVTAEQKASGQGFDAGLLLRSLKDRWRLSASGQDLNKPRIRWGTGAVDVLPATARAGLLLRVGSVSELTAQEEWRQRHGRTFGAGMAHSLMGRFLTLRAGMRRADRQDAWSASAGVGFRIRQLNIDYAWERHRDLGDSQVLSLSLRMGPS